MVNEKMHTGITGGLGHGWDGGFTDGRLDAPTFHRNHAGICAVVRRHIHASSGTALEIGSGTGQHVVGFSKAMPYLRWQPSDPDRRYRASINAWRNASEQENIEPAADLDVGMQPWTLPQAITRERLIGVISINVIHIAPWSVTTGLFEGAAQHLAPGAPLVLYGPFMENGVHSAPGNAAFDAQLKSRDPSFGIRDIRDLTILGKKTGLHLTDKVAMPANNLTLVFERQQSPRRKLSRSRNF